MRAREHHLGNLFLVQEHEELILMIDNLITWLARTLKNYLATQLPLQPINIDKL